jgi:palmitoyltransferase
MDHHCLFLLTCVAKKNHSLFCWFIISCLVCMTMFLVHCAFYISRSYSGQVWSSVLYTMFWSDCWVMSLIAMNGVSIFWGVNLLRFQLTLVSKGVTTVFMSKSKSALTQQERLLNIFHFLIGKQPFAEDPLICAPNTQSV